MALIVHGPIKWYNGTDNGPADLNQKPTNRHGSSSNTVSAANFHHKKQLESSRIGMKNLNNGAK